MAGFEQLMHVPDNTVGEICTEGALQKCPPMKTEAMLKQVKRVLVPGGKFTVFVPDIKAASIMMLRGETNEDVFYVGTVLGYSTREDFERDIEKVGMSPPNRSVYSPDRLFSVLLGAGFVGAIPLDPITHKYLSTRLPDVCGFECYKPRGE